MQEYGFMSFKTHTPTMLGLIFGVVDRTCSIGLEKEYYMNIPLKSFCENISQNKVLLHFSNEQ